MKDLFEYQRVALDRLHGHFKDHDSALLVMASGLGKSVVAAKWAKEQLTHGRGLVLCHDTNILDQLMNEFRDAMGQTVSFGAFNGTRKDTEALDILFATFQTFREWRKVFMPNEFTTIIVDEAHHSEAATYRQVVDYFKPKKRLGLTATPDRMDGRDIRELFGDEVVSICLEEAIASGWLTPIEYHIVTDDLNLAVLKQILKQIDAGSHRFSVKQLNETIFIRKRDEEIAKIIMSHGKKTIVFCESIAHTRSFSQHLPGARIFHCKNSRKDNREILDDFREGRCQYLLTVDKFNEGIDVPDAGAIVFLRCTNSQRIFLQQLGRGLRKVEEKDKVVVLDFVGNCDRVIAVQQMLIRVLDFTGRKRRENRRLFYVEGMGFKFIFSDEFRDIADIIHKVQQKLYISDIPHLLAEYDREKNPLPPEQVRAGTHQKINWICFRGHEWQAAVNNRVRGNGCPVCANQVVTKDNCLAVTHPELAKEFHQTKNAPLTAYDVMAGTNQKIHWICPKGHEWQARGLNRLAGTGCPVCSNRVVTKNNCLATTHPDLAREFHPTKNAPLTAYEVVAGTNRKIHWICSKGHEWQAIGSGRLAGHGCSACCNQIVVEDNCLATTHPDLAREFHPTKNAPLTVHDVIAGTSKKIHWICFKGHEWQTTGDSRARGSGCSRCARKNAWEKRHKNMALKNK